MRRDCVFDRIELHQWAIRAALDQLVQTRLGGDDAEQQLAEIPRIGARSISGLTPYCSSSTSALCWVSAR